MSNEPQSQNRGSLILYYLNAYLTLLAANMFLYGIVIFTTQMTGSSGFTGIVFLTTFLLPLLFSIPAGALIDSRSRKVILFISQVIFAISALALFLLVHGEILTSSTRWLLIGIALANGAGYTLMIPARLAILGDLTPQENVGKATILLNVLVILGFSSAPVVAGQIRQNFPFDFLFLAIAGIFLLAFLILLLVRTHSTIIRTGASTPTLVALRESFGYIGKNPLVKQLLIFTSVALFMLGPIQVIFPRFAQSILEMSESGRGIFLSALGIGLFTGSVVANILNKGKKRGWIILATALVAGLATVAFANSRLVAPAMILLGTVGLCGGVVNSLVPAALQHHVPNELRGRVMSVYSLVFQITPAVSGALSGILADKLGIAAAVAYSGFAVAALVLLGGLTMRSIRTYD
ncbi:MAG: MFS transporter [Spirochaetia bacterium]|nr:MFS transporter [Spirochaetia bacterium]